MGREEKATTTIPTTIKQKSYAARYRNPDLFFRSLQEKYPREPPFVSCKSSKRRDDDNVARRCVYIYLISVYFQKCEEKSQEIDREGRFWDRRCICVSIPKLNGARIWRMYLSVSSSIVQNPAFGIFDAAHWAMLFVRSPFLGSWMEVESSEFDGRACDGLEWVKAKVSTVSIEVDGRFE